MPHSPPRNSPLISPASIALLVLVLCTLGAALWFDGGAAFNPGPVSAKAQPGIELQGFRSHADFENQCRACHQPFQTDQASLCLKCHQVIQNQLLGGNSLHARLDKPRECAGCHREHQGRDFDPSQAALASFDHARTQFPLDGDHGTLDCQRCHSSGDFSGLRFDCSACHSEPPAHAGLLGTDCAACHTPFDWRPAAYLGQAFDHRKVGFTLDLHAVNYQQAPLLCTACHPGREVSAFDPQPCQACHAAHDPALMQKHLQLYGLKCLDCHDGVDRLHGFNHQVAFPLEGRHANRQCADCHINNHFRDTPARCAACHQEPAIHAGFFGEHCDYCHTIQGWRPALLQAHTFPLKHGSDDEIPCQTCHPAAYAAYRCDTCHEHAWERMQQRHASLGLSPTGLADCVRCHLNGRTRP